MTGVIPRELAFLQARQVALSFKCEGFGHRKNSVKRSCSPRHYGLEVYFKVTQRLFECAQILLHVCWQLDSSPV